MLCNIAVQMFTLLCGLVKSTTLFQIYPMSPPHGTRKHKSALNVYIIASVHLFLSSLSRLAVTSVLNVAVRVEMLSDLLYLHRFVHLSLLHNTREWSIH